MFEWLNRRPKPAPLTGAPVLRREKTYSAQSGYVYQYHYEGRRPAARGREHGTEFVFLVSADRKNSIPVSVFVGDAAVESWQEAHGRELAPTERYAIAKMALFQAFDERDHPRRMTEEVRIRPSDVQAILDTLGLD